jgi:leader peptidase (prepilin peptidase)/N-methyltransferase
VLAAVAWPALVLAAVLAAVLTALIPVLIPVAAAIGVPSAVGSRVPASARAGPRPWRWRLAGRAVPHGPSMLVATWLVTVVLLALGAGPGGGGR